MLHDWILNIKKMKKGAVFSIIGSLLAVVACGILLFDHLLKIQVPERLRYIKDYKDFTLSVKEVNDCENQVYSLFQYEDTIYNGICIREVTVNYGSVKASLEYILKSGYIELEDIQKKLSNVDEGAENPIYFEYRRSESKDENYRVTITPKVYQNVSMREVTFERYLESEVVGEKDVQVEGNLDIE